MQRRSNIWVIRAISMSAFSHFKALLEHLFARKHTPNDTNR